MISMISFVHHICIVDENKSTYIGSDPKTEHMFYGLMAMHYYTIHADKLV